MMPDESTCECFLLSLAAGAGSPRRRKVTLPPLRETLEFIAKCVVHESPEHPHCIVVVSTSSVEAHERFLLHCRPGDKLGPG